MVRLGFSPTVLSTITGKPNVWDDRLKGATIASKPQVGALAIFDSDSRNHVAVVEQVNSDGSYILSESNWDGKEYSSRVISPGKSSAPDKFIIIPKA